MKTIKKTIFEVDYNEFDRAATEFLKSKGVDVESDVVCDNEWSNDSQHSCTVKNTSDDFFEKYAKPSLLKGELSSEWQSILQWMCIDGLIEPGEYIIDICW